MKSSDSKSSKLKLSFSDGPSYHTLRYDFKPASVSDEPAVLESHPNGHVIIKAPNLGGSSSTIFRGQRRPHVKECLLIIDNKTGEMVLQKLTDNITVKATRTGAPNNNNGTSSNDNGTTSNDNGTSSNSNGSCNDSNNRSIDKKKEVDGPQLSESSSDSDDSDSSSSSSASSKISTRASSPNEDGFTF